MEYTGERGNVPRITFDSEFPGRLIQTIGCTANERIRNEGGPKQWECQALTLYSENLQRHLNREMTTELLP